MTSLNATPSPPPPFPVALGSLTSGQLPLSTHRSRILSRAMPDIEAHITGNVWKIEVAVGDRSRTATRS